MSELAVGQAVRTPMGKGVVEAVRNNGRIVVRIQDRAVVVDARDVRPEPTSKPRRTTKPRQQEEGKAKVSGSPGRIVTVDLHGLVVEAALERAATALNEALLDDAAELHFVHGRSGGRIRGALQRWLRGTPSVRSMRLDARNPGVTIVTL